MAKITRSEGKTVVDVREDLRAGREPFGDIMAALNGLPPGDRLVVYATFKPEPLIDLLASRGFESEAVPLSGGEWRVTFSRSEA